MVEYSPNPGPCAADAGAGAHLPRRAARWLAAAGGGPGPDQAHGAGRAGRGEGGGSAGALLCSSALPADGSWLVKAAQRQCINLHRSRAWSGPRCARDGAVAGAAGRVGGDDGTARGGDTQAARRRDAGTGWVVQQPPAACYHARMYRLAVLTCGSPAGAQRNVRTHARPPPQHAQPRHGAASRRCCRCWTTPRRSWAAT